MTTATKTTKKTWILMSVPGREENGSDTAWFAYNQSTYKSIRCGSMAEAKKVVDAKN